MMINIINNSWTQFEIVNNNQTMINSCVRVNTANSIRSKRLFRIPNELNGCYTVKMCRKQSVKISLNTRESSVQNMQNNGRDWDS